MYNQELLVLVAQSLARNIIVDPNRMLPPHQERAIVPIGKETLDTQLGVISDSLHSAVDPTSTETTVEGIRGGIESLINLIREQAKYFESKHVWSNYAEIDRAHPGYTNLALDKDGRILKNVEKKEEVAYEISIPPAKNAASITHTVYVKKGSNHYRDIVRLLEIEPLPWGKEVTTFWFTRPPLEVEIEIRYNEGSIDIYARDLLQVPHEKRYKRGVVGTHRTFVEHPLKYPRSSDYWEKDTSKKPFEDMAEQLFENLRTGIPIYPIFDALIDINVALRNATSAAQENIQSGIATVREHAYNKTRPPSPSPRLFSREYLKRLLPGSRYQNNGRIIKL